VKRVDHAKKVAARIASSFGHLLNQKNMGMEKIQNG